MKRLYIPLKYVEIFDTVHRPSGDGDFIVDQSKDGKSTEEHKEGIEYIKGILKEGAKILPVLVKDNEDGTYTRLDGFKRCMAQFQLGYEYIEAFVCSKEEYRQAIEVPFRKFKMRAWHGGQDGDDGKFPLLEGGEQTEFKYENTDFLYKSPNPEGLRIEVAECIHVHWGPYGRFRFALGRRDFEQLAGAVSKIWEK